MYSVALLSIIYLLSGSASASPFPSPQAAPMGGTAASVYPQKAAGDAPYSVPEAQLKAAIKFPSGFKPGEKIPVILAPGTGVTGTQTYVGNFNKILLPSPSYVPINLDIPDSLLDDVQQNAEYHAYAINSISAMTGIQVKIVTWSQGGLDCQWALKYWPSTRQAVSDFVAISPDLNGTTLYGFGPYLEAIQGPLPLAPALFQQEADSVFMKTIRANGGDSAFVPTTSIYSNADEVVQPQEGTAASAFFKSNNGVPAANYQVQAVCAGQAAGGNFTHEGVLYNSFAIAVALDAFANPGPGDARRLDLPKVCARDLAEGLDANDKKLTDDTITEAAENILYNTAVFNVQTSEPEIKAYAKKDSPPGYSAPSLTGTLSSILVRHAAVLERRGVNLEARHGLKLVRRDV